MTTHPGRKSSFPGEFQFLQKFSHEIISISFSPRWRFRFPPRHLHKVSISHSLLNKSISIRNMIKNINLNKTYAHAIITCMHNNVKYLFLRPPPPNIATIKKISLNMCLVDGAFLSRNKAIWLRSTTALYMLKRNVRCLFSQRNRGFWRPHLFHLKIK